MRCADLWRGRRASVSGARRRCTGGGRERAFAGEVFTPYLPCNLQLVSSSVFSSCFPLTLEFCAIRPPEYHRTRSLPPVCQVPRPVLYALAEVCLQPSDFAENLSEQVRRPEASQPSLSKSLRTLYRTSLPLPAAIWLFRNRGHTHASTLSEMPVEDLGPRIRHSMRE